MQAPLIVAHTKILFSIMMGAGLGAMAWLDLNQQNGLLALITTGLSTLMVLNGLYVLASRGHNESSYIEILFIILLASYSLLSAHYQTNDQAIYWIYFYPLAAFYLFKLKIAIILVVLYIPIALYIIIAVSDLIARHQAVFSFVSIALVALFMAIVKEKTNELLEPLISTDLSTGAQQEKRLLPELSIEINRAEREGTGLLLMLFGTGKVLKASGKTNYARDLHDAAATIAQHLRPFDAFYRLDNDNFAVVLPHTTSSDAKQLSQKVLEHLPLSQSVNMGFASLNVADTAESLISSAKASLDSALHHESEREASQHA